MSATLETTPIIHSNEITSRKYLGTVETESGDVYEIVRINHPSGKYLVAGSACNTGLISEFARLIEDGEGTEEALQDFVADLETPDAPSGALLAWHGSLVI